jgi:hypothetical protein
MNAVEDRSYPPARTTAASIQPPHSVGEGGRMADKAQEKEKGKAEEKPEETVPLPPSAVEALEEDDEFEVSEPASQPAACPRFCSVLTL